MSQYNKIKVYNIALESIKWIFSNKIFFVYFTPVVLSIALLRIFSESPHAIYTYLYSFIIIAGAFYYMAYSIMVRRYICASGPVGFKQIIKEFTSAPLWKAALVSLTLRLCLWISFIFLVQWWLTSVLIVVILMFVSSVWSSLLFSVFVLEPKLSFWDESKLSWLHARRILFRFWFVLVGLGILVALTAITILTIVGLTGTTISMFISVPEFVSFSLSLVVAVLAFLYLIIAFYLMCIMPSVFSSIYLLKAIDANKPSV